MRRLDASITFDVRTKTDVTRTEEFGYDPVRQWRERRAGLVA